ncbi:Adenosylcobinamide kinase (EC / Adenosylcobinamide-phosphate guanylyltransferase (EC [Olavius sp. associated proteobacterium Delta 1]|nr:Adenosylcobinamide kinase (EC / Adenosylcobinamide-phosphate guanylyltransferase (EC [Olavius sp. associated proteobacterium Delta 1]
MKKTVFVLGGCRSGKSSYALETAHKFSGNNKVFIATCIPHDDEMNQRVARHRQERSQAWKTIEAPIRLPEAIIEISPSSDAIIVDCLTLWISNLLMDSDNSDKIEMQIPRLTDAIKKSHCPIVLVSNEVGQGIVPENKLARQFRDLVGYVNQAVAGCANEVIWTVAGIPVKIKG